MFDFTETDGLFENFEVNREPFWPQISWLIAGSGVWHLVLLACIIWIPPVRNALNIVVLFSGGGFVDRPYNKTEIEQGDITEITLEKFHYPEGYFAMDQQGMPIEQLPPPVPLIASEWSPGPRTNKYVKVPSYALSIEVWRFSCKYCYSLYSDCIIKLSATSVSRIGPAGHPVP